MCVTPGLSHPPHGLRPCPLHQSPSLTTTTPSLQPRICFLTLDWPVPDISWKCSHKPCSLGGGLSPQCRVSQVPLHAGAGVTVSPCPEQVWPSPGCCYGDGPSPCTPATLSQPCQASVLVGPPGRRCWEAKVQGYGGRFGLTECRQPGCGCRGPGGRGQLRGSSGPPVLGCGPSLRGQPLTLGQQAEPGVGSHRRIPRAIPGEHGGMPPCPHPSLLSLPRPPSFHFQLIFPLAFRGKSNPPGETRHLSKRVF